MFFYSKSSLQRFTTSTHTHVITVRFWRVSVNFVVGQTQPIASSNRQLCEYQNMTECKWTPFQIYKYILSHKCQTTACHDMYYILLATTATAETTTTKSQILKMFHCNLLFFCWRQSRINVVRTIKFALITWWWLHVFKLQ